MFECGHHCPGNPTRYVRTPEDDFNVCEHCANVCMSMWPLIEPRPDGSVILILRDEKYGTENAAEPDLS
jgi:hypothetical protein